MSLTEALYLLRSSHDPELASALQPPVTRLPTPAEVDDAETELGVIFHVDYRRFLLEGSDIVAGRMFPAVVTSEAGTNGLLDMTKSARRFLELPQNLLPICEDNGDYFCMAASGQSSQVLYWSHDGVTDENWQDLATWITQVWLKKR